MNAGIIKRCIQIPVCMFEEQRGNCIMRKYKHLDTLPIGCASDEITEGCLVLEGGAGIGNRSVSVKTGRD